MEILQTHPELEALGFRNLKQVYWQLHTPQLVEESLRRQEGYIAHLGALVVRTGDQTGRSPKDKYVVNEPGSSDHIWWGSVNQKFSPEKFDALMARMLSYFEGRNMFVQNLYAGADKDHRLSVRSRPRPAEPCHQRRWRRRRHRRPHHRARLRGAARR